MKCMVAHTPDDGAVVAGHFAVGATPIERAVADATCLVFHPPSPRRHRIPVQKFHLHHTTDTFTGLGCVKGDFSCHCPDNSEETSAIRVKCRHATAILSRPNSADHGANKVLRTDRQTIIASVWALCPHSVSFQIVQFPPSFICSQIGYYRASLLYTLPNPYGESQGLLGHGQVLGPMKSRENQCGSSDEFSTSSQRSFSLCGQ